MKPREIARAPGSIGQQEQLTEILESDDELIAKVRRVMQLGFVEEVADDLVERYQLGYQPPIYYKQLTGQSGWVG